MLRREKPSVNPVLSCAPAWFKGDVARMLAEDPPPVRWLVEGLIPAGMPGILAARAGAGKSMTALMIAMGLASGVDVLGLPVSLDAARGVLFVGLEDDEPEFHRRFHRGVELLQDRDGKALAYREGMILRLVPIFPNRASGVSFSLKEQLLDLVEMAQGIPGGCGLIVLDTLSRMANGDENSASEMRSFNEATAALAQATGASVLSIHHVGKGNDGNGEKKLWQRLHPEALRGSSAVEAAARFILQMAALSPSEAEAAGLDADAALRGGYVALNLSKMSAAEKGATVLLERLQAHEPGAGFLRPHPDSERILAVIQGQAALRKLTRRDDVLLAIASAGGLKALDQRAEASKIWPESGNPKGQWDKILSGLRKTGLLKDPFLSEAGWKQAESLGFRPSGSNANREVAMPERIEGSGHSTWKDGAEGVEGGPAFPSGGLEAWKGRKDPRIERLELKGNSGIVSLRTTADWSGGGLMRSANWKWDAAIAYLGTLRARGLALGSTRGGGLIIPLGHTEGEIELVKLLKPELLALNEAIYSQPSPISVSNWASSDEQTSCCSSAARISNLVPDVPCDRLLACETFDCKEERAAIHEYDAGFTREESERMAGIAGLEGLQGHATVELGPRTSFLCSG